MIETKRDMTTAATASGVYHHSRSTNSKKGEKENKDPKMFNKSYYRKSVKENPSEAHAKEDKITRGTKNNGDPFKIFPPRKSTLQETKKSRSKQNLKEMPPHSRSTVTTLDPLKKSTSDANHGAPQQPKYLVTKHHLPRVHRNMGIEELQDEARCRGLTSLDEFTTKDQILDELVEGSIRLGETKVYNEYMKMLARMDEEKPKLKEKHMRRKLRRERRAAADKEAHDQLREEEVTKQAKLHTHNFPNIHCHPLAKSEFLSHSGKPRVELAVCQQCKDANMDVDNRCTSQVAWTCESCNWDICQACFIRAMDEQMDLTCTSDLTLTLTASSSCRDELATVSGDTEGDDTESSELVARLSLVDDGDDDDEQSQKQNASPRAYRYDPPDVFNRNAISPPPNYQDREGGKGKGYTVWFKWGPVDASTANINSGFARKDFDSTWPTREEADARARYLYHWKNCCELSATDVHGSSPSPTDSCWTVGVVSDHELSPLSDALFSHHHYNQEYQNKEYDSLAESSSMGDIDSTIRMEHDAHRRVASRGQWNALRFFKPTIIDPPESKKVFPKTDTSPSSFVVWCSSGFVTYGSHLQEKTPPDQVFDSVWESVHDANDRAKYLFY